MKRFHVQQRFHPVGHGTFMTGLLTVEGQSRFTWVYDCGSKRKEPREESLNRMHISGLWPDRIDMLVLSHFDDDHVNGLEALLKLRSVKCLVLPFSDWQQRVREVCIGGKKGISPSTAQLQLDPLGWLQSLDLGGQVETLMLVRGGPVDPDALPPDPTPLPTDPEKREGGNLRNPEGAAPVLRDLSLGGGGKSSVVKAVEIRHHRTPVSVQGTLMEFMFYNAELSGSELKTIVTVGGNLVARKSGLPLAKVRSDIEAEIVALGLNLSFSTWPTGWRSKLKKCYEKHFGSSSHARNNISLCMFARPTFAAIGVQRCELFKNPSGANDHKIGGSFDFVRCGLLCTGDLKLSRAGISAMQGHFGRSRWSGIGLTQVPHHGSEHSWSAGIAALLAPSHFVHCAPGTPAHPHKNVVRDLVGHQVFTADYANSVTLQYHFSAP